MSNLLQITTIIVSILALIGAILFHLFKTTWWMATLSSALTTLTLAVQKIEERILKIDSDYARRNEVDKELGKLEASIEAAHKRIDEINK